MKLTTKEIINDSTTELNKMDLEYMKKNREELAKTLDADKFFENEEKRRKWFMKEMRIIVECQELLTDILDK